MAYGEVEDKDMEMDESEMYEDESLYEASDTFGEQIGESDEAAAESDYEVTKEDRSSSSATESSRVEEAFGETISHEENPHLADQMDDNKLGEEAQADYSADDLD